MEKVTWPGDFDQGSRPGYLESQGKTQVSPGASQLLNAGPHEVENLALRILIWGLWRLSGEPAFPKQLNLSTQIKSAAGSKLPLSWDQRRWLSP